MEDRKYPAPLSTIREGDRVGSKTGREYKVANYKVRPLATDRSRAVETMQLERAVPKVKGKAARRADKKARRLERERDAREGVRRVTYT